MGERKQQEKIPVLFGLRRKCSVRHSGGNRAGLSLQHNVKIPYAWIDEYIHHVGSTISCSSVVQSGLIAGGGKLERRTTNGGATRGTLAHDVESVLKLSLSDQPEMVLKTEDSSFGKRMPMHHLRRLEKWVQYTIAEISCRTLRLPPRSPPKVCLNNILQDEQESTGIPVADQVTIRPEVDLGKLIHAIMFHPNKDALIAEWQSNTPYSLFSEESKQVVHTLGNVESFELCHISHKVQCLSCVKYWMEGIMCCDCGTCCVPSEEARRLDKERPDVLIIPFFTFKNGANWEARRG